jgi:hypothetical protein
MTFTEKRRVMVNLLIRLALIGFLTWWIVDRAASSPAWGTAIYAFLDLLMLGLAVMLAVGFERELRSGPGG